MPEDEEVDVWKGIEIPKRLEAQWYDIQDYLTDEDDIQRAILKVLIYQTRLMQGRGGEEEEAPLKRLTQLNSLPIEPTNFEQIETPDPISVSPGEREEIVSWDVFPTGILWEVGVESYNYTSYRVKVDGDYIFGEAQYEPLGTFDDPYRLPNPILVQDDIIVEVKRHDDAPDSQTYIAKVRGIDGVPASLYRSLKQVWEL